MSKKDKNKKGNKGNQAQAVFQGTAKEFKETPIGQAGQDAGQDPVTTITKDSQIQEMATPVQAPASTPASTEVVNPAPMEEFKPETETFMDLRPKEEPNPVETKVETKVETPVKKSEPKSGPGPATTQKVAGSVLTQTVQSVVPPKQSLVDRIKKRMTAACEAVEAHWEKAKIHAKFTPSQDDSFQLTEFETRILEASQNHLEKYIKGLAENLSDEAWNHLKNKSICIPAHVQNQIERMKLYRKTYGFDSSKAEGKKSA